MKEGWGTESWGKRAARLYRVVRESLCDKIFFTGNEDMNLINIWSNILGRGNHEYNSGRGMHALWAQQRGPECLDRVSRVSG